MYMTEEEPLLEECEAGCSEHHCITTLQRSNYQNRVGGICQPITPYCDRSLSLFLSRDDAVVEEPLLEGT